MCVRKSLGTLIYVRCISRGASLEELIGVLILKQCASSPTDKGDRDGRVGGTARLPCIRAWILVRPCRWFLVFASFGPVLVLHWVVRASFCIRCELGLLCMRWRAVAPALAGAHVRWIVPFWLVECCRKWVECVVRSRSLARARFVCC